ncbi:protein PAXX isoform X1 [Pleurodeles waltl]|uniref:protein PAXX isoform X1 n=1 Tax=Pleurodeles waltl TaxID=8319 RepID=UPI00370966D1
MTQLASFGPLCPLTHGGQQYLCYICPKDGALKIYVTNAIDLWSAEITKEALEEQKYLTGVLSTEDYCSKFREAFDHGTTSLLLQDSRASLSIKEDTWTTTFDLFKQPVSETKAQVQSLLFSLVERANSLEKRLQAAEGAAALAASGSPDKSLSKTQRLLMSGLPQDTTTSHTVQGAEVTNQAAQDPGAATTGTCTTRPPSPPDAPVAIVEIDPAPGPSHSASQQDTDAPPRRRRRVHVPAVS